MTVRALVGLMILKKDAFDAMREGDSIDRFLQRVAEMGQLCAYGMSNSPKQGVPA